MAAASFCLASFTFICDLNVSGASLETYFRSWLAANSAGELISGLVLCFGDWCYGPQGGICLLEASAADQMDTCKTIRLPQRMSRLNRWHLLLVGQRAAGDWGHVPGNSGSGWAVALVLTTDCVSL